MFIEEATHKFRMFHRHTETESLYVVDIRHIIQHGGQN